MDIKELQKQLQPGEHIVIQVTAYVIRDNSSEAIIRNVNSEPPIGSNPPSGHFRVTNLYVNSATGTLVIEYDDRPC